MNKSPVRWFWFISKLKICNTEIPKLFMSSSPYKRVRRRRGPESRPCARGSCSLERLYDLNQTERLLFLSLKLVVFNTKQNLCFHQMWCFTVPENELSVSSFVYHFYPISVYLWDRDSRGNHIVWKSEIRDVVVTIWFLMHSVGKHTQTHKHQVWSSELC